MRFQSDPKRGPDQYVAFADLQGSVQDMAAFLEASAKRVGTDTMNLEATRLRFLDTAQVLREAVEKADRLYYSPAALADPAPTPGEQHDRS